MPETSKLATPAFVGFSLSIAALFMAITKPDTANITTPLMMYGIIIVIIESVKDKNHWVWMLWYGTFLSFIWSTMIMFMTRDIAIRLNYTDANSPDDYISVVYTTASAVMIVCLMSIGAGIFWEKMRTVIRSKFQIIPEWLSGNHIGFIVSGAILLLVGTQVYFNN